LAARRLWKDYFTTVDGVVFLVDAIDQERFPEAKRELDVSSRQQYQTPIPFLPPHDDGSMIFPLRRC